jgi:putative transferase (TIGR04331 family)
MNKRSLATTALEEFWDPSMPVVFLGEWCRKYDRRAFWEPLGGTVAAPPVNGRQQAVAAYEYVGALYEALLPRLAEILNEIHGVKRGVGYWRLFAGMWLLHYISVLYDRYSQLDSVLSKESGLITTGLDEAGFITPSDTMEFVERISEDLFNLQIYTKILLTVPEWAGCVVERRMSRAPAAARTETASLKTGVKALARGLAKTQ